MLMTTTTTTNSIGDLSIDLLRSFLSANVVAAAAAAGSILLTYQIHPICIIWLNHI